MQELSRRRALGIGLRARVPLVARIIAFVLLAVGIGFVARSYYKNRNQTKFTLAKNPAELSKDITGVIEGYEQRMTKPDGSYLLVKASRDITFSDSHHELENINVAVYPATGNVPDQISATRGIYQPAADVISFIGNVKIETKDKLKVMTDALSLDRNSEIAQTDSPITFERENISGRSTGAIVEQKSHRLQLKKDVEITISPNASVPNGPSLSAKSRPVAIKSAVATFEQDQMKLSFNENVIVQQDPNVMSGDALTAILTKEKHLQKCEVRGNSYLRTLNPGHAAEMHSVNMDFFLDKDQRLESAAAWDNVTGRTINADSEVEWTGAHSVDVKFQTLGNDTVIKQLDATGRSVVNMAAPKSKANDKRSANKRLTADQIKLFWRANGQDLEKAEANGNAELFVDPIDRSDASDRKTVTAPNMACEFLAKDNLAKSCTATGGAKSVIDPVQPTPKRGTRTLTSQTMIAAFIPDTQDIERFDAQGDAKFNENDRNGIASTLSYTAADQMVRLRGGDPTVWDSRGRTKGTELDSDLANKISYSRGRTSTTYYSQEQTNGATPFSKVKSPVYVVSDKAEFHHETGLASYTGNARAWQDDNFVRGDKINLYVNSKTMDASGHVQTGIYNSKRKVDNNSVVVPVFASSDSLSYSDPDRTIHYEGNVDIKQGTDRMTSGVADVYLMKETNEMDKTIAQRNVVLTQPNRKGIGDWVQYTAADEVAVLKGNPARVEDTEKGNTEGGRLTLSIRDSKVTADDARGPLSPGRIRTTHKINKKP
ncbi:MAG TPA: LPS export ABC transporter periplasmic protein LptC [Pyrinomonadaceae bacterium]